MSDSCLVCQMHTPTICWACLIGAIADTAKLMREDYKKPKGVL